MATIVEQVEDAVGLDKFVVLASTLDSLVEAQARVAKTESLDDQIETLDICELADKFSTSPETLRKKIDRQLSKKAAFKIGSRWVIRKRTFLDFLEACEAA